MISLSTVTEIKIFFIENAKFTIKEKKIKLYKNIFLTLFFKICNNLTKWHNR